MLFYQSSSSQYSDVTIINRSSWTGRVDSVVVVISFGLYSVLRPCHLNVLRVEAFTTDVLTLVQILHNLYLRLFRVGRMMKMFPTIKRTRASHVKLPWELAATIRVNI